MWKCSVCEERIEPDFDVCWNCGSARDQSDMEDFNPETEGVMDESAYADELNERREASFTKLATFWNAAEAHLLLSRLESEGVRAFVTDELTNTTFFGMGSLAGGVTVQVAEKDYERARLIYSEIRREDGIEEA